MGILAGRELADPRLSRAAVPTDFVEVVGERAALLGREEGVFELWVWPIEVLHDLRFALARPGAREVLPWTARTVSVTPGGLELDFEAPDSRLVLAFFAAREERVVCALPRLEAREPLELRWSFRCDLRPMWPAGMGGQLALVDAETGAAALTEELGRFAYVVGAPGARVELEALDHALPAEPVVVAQLLEPGAAGAPLVLAGAERAPEPLSEAARLGLDQSATGLSRARAALDEARALWRRVAEDPEAVRDDQRGRWRRFLATTTRLETPDARFDEAFLWAKVALERAWVRVDGLGRGLVAGLAPAGAGARPGYGWFFDGDALTAARAMAAYGDFAGAREVLRFAASHQREDGKLMHELTLSAGLCDWLGSYPYAYYKGLNNADFVASCGRVLAAGGDVELAEELAATVQRALAWCRACVDERGRVSNRRAGIAAVEAGPLSDRIESEVFLQGAWLDALASAERLARARGAEDEARALGGWRQEAERGLEELWSDERRRYGFAALVDGTRRDDLSAYTARPLARGGGRPERARATLEQLNEPRLAADWGLRMFASDSDVYDPAHYNTGAVFPYLTNFATLALYAGGLPAVGFQVLDSQVALARLGAQGFVDEHLLGDRALVPPRGVAHQVFSSSAIVESTVHGLFGLAPRAEAGELRLRPALPPAWERMALRGVRVGATRLDVELEQRSEGGVARWSARVTRLEGPPIALRVEPLFAPLTLVRGATLDGAPCEVALGTHGAARVRAAFAPATLEDRRTFALELARGPEPALPPLVLERGARSQALRLTGEALAGGAVRYTLWGPRGATRRVDLRGERPVRAAAAAADGRALSLERDAAGVRLSFPDGADDFTRLELRLEVDA